MLARLRQLHLPHAASQRRTHSCNLMVEELERRTLLSASAVSPAALDVIPLGIAGTGSPVDTVTALVGQATQSASGIVNGVPPVVQGLPPTPPVNPGVPAPVPGVGSNPGSSGTGQHATTSAPAGQFGPTSSFPGTDVVRELVRLDQNETTGLPVPANPLPAEDFTPNTIGAAPAASSPLTILGAEPFLLRQVPGPLQGQNLPANATTARPAEQAEAPTPVAVRRTGVLDWQAASDWYFAEQAALAGTAGLPEEAAAALPEGNSTLAALFGLGMTAAGLGGYLSDPEPEAEGSRPRLPVG